MTDEEFEDLIEASLARDTLLDFMKYCWIRPNAPLLIGRHTREICEEIDKAIADYREYKSSYLHIVVPFRHGKSDISSRYLVAYFLGHFPDDEVIQAAYGATLSEGFSKDVKKIMESEEYKKVFPGIVFDKGTNSNSERHIEDHTGKYYAVGAEGGATGKGSNLLIVDDFFKNRKEAESELKRSTRWDSLTQDFMTRLGPRHIVLVLNTRWHVDDISGNILNRNDPTHEDYKEEFPKFKNLHFKAQADDGSYLFNERFSDKWYEGQKATLGEYGFQSLMQGDPTLRGGNMFEMDKLVEIESEDELLERFGIDPESLLDCRAWDLASTEKERVSDDPDYTAGCLGSYTELDSGYVTEGNNPLMLPVFIMKDMKKVRAEAPGRNKLIVRTANSDGPTVWQGTESVAGYKDSYTILDDVLKGVSVVHKISVNGDKIVRASVLEPVIEKGHFIYIKGKYIKDTKVLEEMREFPASKHDDMVDAEVLCFNLAKERYTQSKSLSSKLGSGAC